MIAQRIVLVAALALCGACTEVRVYGADGALVRREFGIATVRIESENAPVYIRTSGLGAVLGSEQATLGWVNQETVAFPESEKCALMIVEPSGAQLSAVENILKLSGHHIDDACVTKGDGNARSNF